MAVPAVMMAKLNRRRYPAHHHINAVPLRAEQVCKLPIECGAAIAGPVRTTVCTAGSSLLQAWMGAFPPLGTAAATSRTVMMAACSLAA